VLVIGSERTSEFDMLVSRLSSVGSGKLIGKVAVTEETTVSFEAVGLIIVLVGGISFLVVGVTLESNDSEMVGLTTLGERIIKCSLILVVT
jgi:uncharacterized membrane protein YhiD involved in acid resistance